MNSKFKIRYVTKKVINLKITSIAYVTIVIGDQQSNPATLPFVDTVFSNASGFAVVDMDQYFNVSGEENTTGYFDIIVKYNNKVAYDYARCRVHTTTVKTIYLPN